MGLQRVRHDWATFTNPFIMKIESIEHGHACLHTPCCSVAQSFPTLCDPMDCSPPGFLVLHHLPELAQTHVHWGGDAIQPSCPLLLLPSIFPCIRVFSNEFAHRISWPKCWSFSFSISASNEYSGLISFRINWFDLLAVQGTLKCLLQHHSSKTSILRHILYGPAPTAIRDYWENHSFDHTNVCRQSTVSAFNALSRFVIALLPRSKCLLISWLQSPSAVTLEPKKIVCQCFHYVPI